MIFYLLRSDFIRFFFLSLIFHCQSPTETTAHTEKPKLRGTESGTGENGD